MAAMMEKSRAQSPKDGTRRKSMTPPPTMSALNVVLLGKTGSGKSATANTILGREAFKEELSFDSVTATCSDQHTAVDGRQITVIDTPGLCDTEIPMEELKGEMEKCVEMSLPGPHAFLLVMRLDVRFTEEERNVVKLIKENFGEGALKYTIVLLTHGDALEGKPVEVKLSKSPALSSVIEQCGGRYYVFNNKSKDSTQVRELKKKIEAMVEKNGGANYTNGMYKNVQRKIRAEEERRKAEKERKEAEKKNNVAQNDLKIASLKRKSAEGKEKTCKAEESAAEERKKTFETDESNAKTLRLYYEDLQKTLKNAKAVMLTGVGSGAALTLLGVGATVLTGGAAAPLILFALAGGVTGAGIGADIYTQAQPKTAEEAREKAEEEGNNEKTAKDKAEKEAAAAATAKTNAGKAGKEAAEARKAEAVAKTKAANATTVAAAAAAAVTVAEAEVAAAAKAVAEAMGR